MKKVIILGCAILASGIVYGQSSYPCVIKDQQSWKLSSYDADLNAFEKPTLDFGPNYVRNTFVKYPDLEQYAFATYDGSSSVVHIRTEADGHYSNNRLYEHVLSLDYSKQTDQLVYLSTTYVPNYYSFLTEDVSITVIDFKNNTDEKIAIPTFSIYVPTLPYIGDRTRKGFNGKETTVNYSISLPTINTDRLEYTFVAKDIPGANRMVRMDLKTKKIETLLVEANVLALVYCPKTKTYKALISEENQIDSLTDYFVVDMDDRTAEISNKVKIASSDMVSLEQDGSIEYDHNSNTLVVTKSIGSENKVYELDAETNEVSMSQTVIQSADMSVPLPFNAIKTYPLGYYTKMYPNPTRGELTIQTTKHQEVNQIVVSDATGRVVKRVEVQSGLESNNIDISALKPGMYYVRIRSGEQDHVEKVIKY